MAIELKVPAVGESITEVQIGEWLKSEGDQVAVDEAIVVIETDKVTVELPAPEAGVITKIGVPTGEVANVGDVIGEMEAGEPEPALPGSKAEPKESEAQSGEDRTGGRAPEEVAEERSEGERPGEQPQPAAASARVMPAAERALAQHGLEASQVKATGPGGRLLKEDVLREAERAANAPAKSPAKTEKAKTNAPEADPSAREEVVPMSPLRRRIAERLVEAQNTAAILSTFNEVDMTRVMALRKENQEAFMDRHGIKLGFMSFFVKAVVESLKLVPAVNAEVREQSIVFKNHYDIGIAVGGGKGLVVPVVRNAEQLSFAEVEKTIADLGKRAKENKIALEELQGGTFTISNGGVYGSLLSTPILNPPQSGILGLHGIQDRPIAVDGEVVVRPMMYIALSYDHRVIDGREAVTFLKHVKECVEDPSRILLEI